MSPARAGVTAALMLDEMSAPAIAERLRAQGIACVAVAAMADLRGRTDADILAAATSEGHVLVTNNVADFEPLRKQRIAAAERVPEIIYTSDRAFPRDRRFSERIVDALADAVTRGLVAQSGGVHWLAPRA